MTEKLNLRMKLLEIRKSVEYIQKTEKGNQGAMYVDPAVLVKTIRDKMDAHKVLLVPEMKDSIVEPIAAPTKNNKDGIGFLYKSTMSYVWMDCESDESISVPWFCTAKHLTDPAMAGGSALTYFERYFLLKFFQIPTSRDDPEYFEDKTAEKVSEKDIIMLSDIIRAKGYENVDPILSQYSIKISKVGNIKNLPVNKLIYAKEFFNDMEEKK